MAESTAPRTAPPTTVPESRRSPGSVLRRVLLADPWLLAVVVVLLAIRTLYVASFPFVVESDVYTYYHLLRQPHSSLIHASGYCLLFWPAKVVAAGLGCSTAAVLSIVQQLVSVVAAAVLHVGLRAVLWRWLAAAVSLLVGGDILFVTAAGTSRPEFLEAALIMVLIGLVLLALTRRDLRSKRRLYTGAGVVFAVAFVTKYNCLPCGVLLLAPLCDGYTA